MVFFEAFLFYFLSFFKNLLFGKYFLLCIYFWIILLLFFYYLFSNCSYSSFLCSPFRFIKEYILDLIYQFFPFFFLKFSLFEPFCLLVFLDSIHELLDTLNFISVYIIEAFSLKISLFVNIIIRIFENVIIFIILDI